MIPAKLFVVIVYILLGILNIVGRFSWLFGRVEGDASHSIPMPDLEPEFGPFIRTLKSRDLGNNSLCIVPSRFDPKPVRIHFEDDGDEKFKRDAKDAPKILSTAISHFHFLHDHKVGVTHFHDTVRQSLLGKHILSN